MYVGDQQWLHIYVKRSTVTTNVCLGSRVAVHIYVCCRSIVAAHI